MKQLLTGNRELIPLRGLTSELIQQDELDGDGDGPYNGQYAVGYSFLRLQELIVDVLLHGV